MTPDRQAEIQRRARTDAVAHLAGWPVMCPFFKADEATEWRKAFDLAIKQAKESK